MHMSNPGNSSIGLRLCETIVNPSSATLGLLNAIMSVGSIVAIPISPWLADWRGRRLAIIIGLAVMFIGVALQTASQDIRMFIGARFLVCF